jgi:O-antigen ligase
MEVKKTIWLQVLFGILLSTVLFGQIFRLDIIRNSAAGLLISDVLVLLIALLLGVLIVAKKICLPRTWVIKLLGIWMITLVLSYVLNFWRYSHSEALVGFGYLVRLISYSSLLVIGYLVANRMSNSIVRYVAYLTVGLIALGVLILYVQPDFTILARLGWDPHQGRMTSTWLDPNYFGSFLAMMFILFLPFANEAKKRGAPYQGAYYVFLSVIWVTLYFTFSRSALATFIVGALFVAAQMSRRAVVSILVLFIITIAIPSRLQSRVAQSLNFSLQQSGVQKQDPAIASLSQTSGTDNTSAQGAGAESVSTDPTSSARIKSWKRAFAVFVHDPILGAGYNFYQYRQRSLGIVSEDAIAHNRSVAGSDSSLLTLLATTGLIGLGAFLTLWGRIVGELWLMRKRALPLGALGLIAGWFVSSFFNNTLLYAPILLPALLVIGLALAEPKNSQIV